MYDENAAKCVCCGVSASLHPLHGPDDKARCGMCCLPCDGIHCALRYTQLIKLVSVGTLTPWDAVACAAFEDAWLAGKAEIDGKGGINIPTPVKRWEALLAWHRCNGTMVGMQQFIDACLYPFIGLRNIATVRDDMAREIHVAMATVDPRTRGVRVEATGGDVTCGGVTVTIDMEGETMDLPMTRTLAPEVDVPADIMTRHRGEA